MNKRNLGSKMENAAADYLTERGYRILNRNFFARTGEIDIVALQDGYLCFIEVKYRSSTEDGEPAEAVDFRKIKRISKAAREYMFLNGYGEDTPCRFDVVTILQDKTELIQNAFDADL